MDKYFYGRITKCYGFNDGVSQRTGAAYHIDTVRVDELTNSQYPESMKCDIFTNGTQSQLKTLDIRMGEPVKLTYTLQCREYTRKADGKEDAIMEVRIRNVQKITEAEAKDIMERKALEEQKKREAWKQSLQAPEPPTQQPQVTPIQQAAPVYHDEGKLPF